VGRAKDIIVKPISAQDGNRIVRALHYSGKVDTRTQIHLGVFLDGKCGGAMQFGPSVNKHASRNLFRDCGWNEWIELHRLAFADWIPRNGESRAIAYAMRWIRKTYPHISFVVSYADGTQCGDGAIYRASGFVLTSVKENTSMIKMPDGEVFAKLVFGLKYGPNSTCGVARKYGFRMGEPITPFLNRVGAKVLTGFQLRYIFFLDPTARARLTVPILPFSEIDRRGAGMYKGKQRIQSRAVSDTKDTADFQSAKGGSTPTTALQSE